MIMWIVYSLVAAFFFGCLTLVITYLAKSGMGSLSINTVFWLSTGLLFLVASLVSRTKIKLPADKIKWFVLLAVLAFIANFFSVKAFQTGPNSGIVRSVQMAQIAVAAVGAYFFFNTAFGYKQGIGMTLIVAGIILIANK